VLFFACLVAAGLPCPDVRSSPPRDRASPSGLLALVACLALAWLAGVGCSCPGAEADGRLRIDFLDVGQGDAALVTSPAGKTVLIDGGLPEAGDTVVAFSGRTPYRHAGLGVSHPPACRSPGWSARCRRQTRTRMFLDAPYPHDIQEYQRLLVSLDRQHVPVRQAIRGRTIDLGEGARLTLLARPSRPSPTHGRTSTPTAWCHGSILASSVFSSLPMPRRRPSDGCSTPKQPSRRSSESGPPRQPVRVDAPNFCRRCSPWWRW